MSILSSGVYLIYPSRRHGIRRSRSLFLLASIGIWLTLLFSAAHANYQLYWKKTVVEKNAPHHHFESVFLTPESGISEMAQYFIDYPVDEGEFGELGRRVSFLRQWIAMAGNSDNTTATPLDDLIPERLALSMFPFLRNPTYPENPRPLASLRNSFVPNSRGLVLTTGAGNFRFACHLIRNIRNVLHSKLPIQIIYGGEADLPLRYRNVMTSLGDDITTMDIFNLFDDETLDLVHGKYAMKPFALLAASFQEVILVDADAIFLQNPEVLLDHHSGYKNTGALLFRDRLMWQADVDHRHIWWRKLLRLHHPSETLQQSVVFNTERDGLRGAHEQDSGVVVLNKGDLTILSGLLHICWQNSKSVRNMYTYVNSFGDKESYWLGLELSGVPYAFEEPYAGIVGSCIGDSVCGTTIAHVDESGKLLWWNGSLLKNKGGFQTEFMTPNCWMLDGTWGWNATHEHGACMAAGKRYLLTDEESSIVMQSVGEAKAFDRILNESLDLDG